MAGFVPRRLDAHEVRVLSVLEGFTQPISITKILRRAENEKTTRVEAYRAIDRLASAGYIVRAIRPSPIRYYVISASRMVIDRQIALGGLVDSHDLTVLVSALLLRSDARDEASVVTAGWVLAALKSWWGYTAAPKAVRTALIIIAGRGHLTGIKRGTGLRYFYATPEQRKLLAGQIADSPLAQGYKPAAGSAPIADSVTPLPVQEHVTQRFRAWLAEIGRPVKLSECRARFGLHTSRTIRRLIADGDVGRLQDGHPSEDDVIYLIRPPAVVEPPEPGPPVPDASVYTSAYGDVEVFRLTEDEYAVLRFMMGRKKAVNPFLVSKHCFGDTTHSQPPWHQAYAPYEIPLRSLPALHSLARKNLIHGDPDWSVTGAAPCAHNQGSTYRLRSNLKKRAVYSLDYTTGKEHCSGCGTILESDQLALCPACAAVQQTRVYPEPGVRLITESDLRIIHAVFALDREGFECRIDAITAFVYHPDSGSDAVRAYSLRRWDDKGARAAVQEGLDRLVRDGYVSCYGKKYRFNSRQYIWAQYRQTSGNWPQTQEPPPVAATPAPVRSGRTVELD
jgi:hypothetical protein